MKQFVIKSLDCYFVAWHSYTPFYGGIDKAKGFRTYLEAHHYAMGELFTDESAFVIEEIG
jgi:hypothetical protein